MQDQPDGEGIIGRMLDPQTGAHLTLQIVHLRLNPVKVVKILLSGAWEWWQHGSSSPQHTDGRLGKAVQNGYQLGDGIIAVLKLRHHDGLLIQGNRGYLVA